MNAKKVHFSILLLVLLLANSFGAGKSIAQANRKTAVRCLKLAESYLSVGDWGNALSQSDLGLAYDDSVADLWYVKAASQNKLGESKANIIPLVKKALSEGEWVDYNREGARILYADLMCDTGNYDVALSVLDLNPFIYTADAEYIRIKAYYCMHSQESISKARDKVNSARKIYPSDMRFPHIFFKFEYDLNRPSNYEKYESLNDEQGQILVQKIADSFINKMPEYDNPDAELEIYATAFANPERKKRMLQAFSAHGMRHPLYAKTALEVNLISQQEAWDYFCSFADNSVTLEMLEDILPYITDDITVESVKQHLNAFAGTLTVDTDQDCEPNLTVKYMRGRPSYFEYDWDNDGVYEWNSSCDFGVPEEVNLNQGGIKLVYGSYPSIVKVFFNSPSENVGASVFTLADETFYWAPFHIETNPVAQELFKLDFFVPYVNNQNLIFDEEELVKACSYYEIGSLEKENATIRFNVVHGQIETADYFQFNTIYAHCFFENGVPVMRSVDNDGDGIFETTEFYVVDKENDWKCSYVDKKQAIINVFGMEIPENSLYLKMIQIDQNGNIIPDFTEEYFADGGKVTSWDYDDDGKWNVRYKIFPDNEDKNSIQEEAEFYKIPENKLVSIAFTNKQPVRVTCDGEIYVVSQGVNRNFYWVGDTGIDDDEVFIMNNFNPDTEQGVSVLLQNQDRRLYVVKIGNLIFGQILSFNDVQ